MLLIITPELDYLQPTNPEWYRWLRPCKTNENWASRCKNKTAVSHLMIRLLFGFPQQQLETGCRSVRPSLYIVLGTNSNESKPPDQHGVRSGHSSLTQLMDQHDKLLDVLSQGKNADLVYLDFAKAFDLCDISIMLT